MSVASGVPSIVHLGDAIAPYYPRPYNGGNRTTNIALFFSPRRHY
ncbi:MAG TPA: hypothetical protein V6D29_16920 [Leptolyngbyaceae cyanobacterium]